MTSIRKVIFVNEYIYHVYNRGVEKRDLFTTQRDHVRFIQTLEYYRFSALPMRYSHFTKLTPLKKEEVTSKPRENLVDILAFCLMSNHFHLLLRQKLDNGISTYLSNVCNSYSRYFNTKHKRVGPLYQGPFQAVFIESEEQLIHVSRYIHLNPVASSLIKREHLTEYPWSSLPDYLTNPTLTFVETDTILSKFADTDAYRDFVWAQIDYSIKLELLKHVAFEE